MAGRIPALSSREVIATLQRAGFEMDHQTGSHVVLRHPVRGAKVTVPAHRGSLPRGTLVSIIRASGLSRQEFLALL